MSASLTITFYNDQGAEVTIHGATALGVKHGQVRFAGGGVEYVLGLTRVLEILHCDALPVGQMQLVGRTHGSQRHSHS